MQTNKKLLLTGSHAGSTAIAIIEEIKRRNLPWEIHWIGKKFATEGSNLQTLEYKNLSKYGVIFHNLESGKIQTKFTKYTIPALFKIPMGIVSSYKLVKEINPDLVLSFGSSGGALSSFWANFFGIPVFVHEQTAAAGRANIFSSYFCKKILISHESSYKYFNKNKTELVGNPINSEIIKYLNKPHSKRIKSILITGGSRGSTWINNAVKPILPKLLEKYYVMHQAGDLNLEEFRKIKNERYLPFGQIAPKEMIEAISSADLVITRGGANTISELRALKKISIIIPIPWTFNDEQTENAKVLEKLGLGHILNQKDLSSQRLFSVIEDIEQNYNKLVNNIKDFENLDLEASRKVVDLIEDNI